MNELTPNTPVIVGIGFEQETSEDPTRCAEPWQLMVRAVRRAAADAGSEALLAQIESISVPQGMWEYRNPGKLISQRQVLQEVWGPTYSDETQYLRQYLTQLRRKLEADPSRPRHLLTEPGMGYRFQP